VPIQIFPAKKPKLTKMALPIIDFSHFLDPASSPAVKRSTAQEIDRACREVGFFYLTGHGIDSALMQHMLDNARTFFEKASPEEKHGLAIKDAGDGIGDSSRGYQRVEGGVKGAHEVGHFIR
jgi:isopenicillin N synthase-like dioxygenase